MNTTPDIALPPPPSPATPGHGPGTVSTGRLGWRPDVVAREVYTWANLATVVRILAGFPFFAATWYTHQLRWSLWGLLIYWVGDLLDGWLARHLRQETLLGAQFDILTDRMQVALFYLSYIYIYPVKTPTALLFLFEFVVLDQFLSNQFARWPVLSPNYFYQVDRLTWRWLWSKPAKAFNCGLVTLLLIGLPWQWPAAVATTVLIGIRIRFTHRMLRLTSVLPPPPPVEPA